MSRRLLTFAVLLASVWPAYACDDAVEPDFYDLLLGYLILALLSSPIAGIAAWLADPAWRKRTFLLSCLLTPPAAGVFLALGITTPLGVPLALCGYVVLLWSSVIGLRYKGPGMWQALGKRT